MRPPRSGLVLLLYLLSLSGTNASDSYEQTEVTDRTTQESVDPTDGRDGMDVAPATTWPSLKLEVQLKRKKMTLHRLASFTIYANPLVSLNGTHVMYDAMAKFVDRDTEVLYTVYDGAAYMTSRPLDGRETVVCLSRHSLPLNAFLPALNRAEPIPRASIGTQPVECPSGHLFKTTFVGIHYALCTSTTGFTAISSDLDVVIEYLPKRIHIRRPELTSDLARACDVLEKPTRLTPLARALVTATDVPSSLSSSRRLDAAAALSLPATECTCPSQPRPCLFFHGLGNPTQSSTLQDTPAMTKPRRMGDMHGHAPCCSKIKYSILNTKDRGWTDATLQEDYCDHMLRMSPTSDRDKKIVRDTIVVSHSMAGNVIAGALANQRCSFAATTSWVSNSPPLGGSMASDYLLDVCEHGLVNEAAEWIGVCPVFPARQSTVYETGKYTNATLVAAYEAAQRAYRDHVAAAICSDTYVGLFSKYQAKAIIGGTVLPHKSPRNDGLVEFTSCLVGKMAPHGKPRAGLECMATMDEITEEEGNYCEFQSYPSGSWHASLYCSDVVEQLLATQFHVFMKKVQEADCKAELRRLVAKGPPIWLEDKHALPLPRGDTHITQVWFAKTNEERSAKLDGAVEGEVREALWTDLQQLLAAMDDEKQDVR
ncbi:hypothetical protein PsorP6_017044 [Peronosclerospora sorghi]|uniref:Uncharacterized protein n=1 Tax=Peronosclerospora sorghi TaxID=230839 RepID=A0ACC0WE52_9STRA|nr:hypothetical protein PsorP6_017044 [Peronosclerospora sorghi]